MKSLFMARFTLPLAMFGAALMSAYAQDFTITKLFIDGHPRGGNVDPGDGELIVPTQNTTLPAYGEGSRLRLYDVHIAKMFEVTIQECQNSREGDIYWDYKAGNGSIDMGSFRITCALADDIKLAYGLGRAEETKVTRMNRRSSREEVTIKNIPILLIQGTKIDNLWKILNLLIN
jgi:hypothetical protein